MKHLSTAALALLLVSALLPVSAAPADTRRTWELNPFTRINRVPSEKGAPVNGHPLTVEPEALSQALGLVRFMAGRGEEPLFAPDEASNLSKALAEALALAEPGEDLELLSTIKRGSGFFSRSLSVTARLFARDGKLDLIVHDARLDCVSPYNVVLGMPKFEYGSRTTASRVVLKAAGAEARRADWLVLTVGASAQAPPPPVAALPPPPPSSTAQPAVAAPLLPAPSAAQPPVAAPGSLEERLRTLKHLREQNLITEEEYAKRKQELLKQI